MLIYADEVNVHDRQLWIKENRGKNQAARNGRLISKHSQTADCPMDRNALKEMLKETMNFSQIWHFILNAPETAAFRRRVLEAHSGSHLPANTLPIIA